jgi:hypothetical protein
MLEGLLLFFALLGVFFFFLSGDDEPVIEKSKQKNGYYDHNNKYYDSFDDYLKERNAEREKEREKLRRERERESSRHESSYEKWQREYESSRYESEYEKWKRERYKREEDKSDINNKVDKLFDLLVKDFTNNPYQDKLESLSGSYSMISFTYKFENGFKFTLNDKEIRVYNRNGENISSYRLGDTYHLKFLKLILEMKQKSQQRFRERNYRTYSEYDFNSKFNDYKREQPKVKSTGNPRLDKINEKIVLREEQLRKMKANDPEREALVNELKTYKNVAEKIKSKIK